jgi:hypothetical protein
MDSPESEDSDSDSLLPLKGNAVKGVCERRFKSQGEKLTDMMSMCVGLKSGDDRELGDCGIEPYTSMKFRGKVAPTQKHLVEETKRRSGVSGMVGPQCTYWKKEKLVEWLQANPVSEPEDIVFLVGEERKLFDSIMRGQQEVNDKTSPRAGAWISNEPYLRLYHCVFHDDIRHLLSSMNNVMDRDELDARNSSERPETFFEAVACIFNDDAVLFVTSSLPDLHYSFGSPIVLDFEDMPARVTPEECKKRFADSRAKLIKIISKWELSGNGFGQRTREDDDFGHLDEECFEAGDNRGNFLDSMTKEHILYFWHLADEHQLMKQVLNVIVDSSSADSENFQATSDLTSASAVSNAKRKSTEARDVSDFRSNMSEALASMSQSALLAELREAENQSMHYQELFITTDNDRLKALYNKFTIREEKRVTEIQSDLDRMKRRRTYKSDDNKAAGSNKSIGSNKSKATAKTMIDSSDEE